MKQTNKNLSSDVATKSLMGWLVAAALDNSFLTYGEAKRRLEQEVGFENIARAGRTGLTAGTMVDKLLRANRNAPLLNVLLVEQATQLPSDGAGGYLAQRFREPLLAEENAKNLHHELWRSTFDTAAGDITSRATRIPDHNDTSPTQMAGRNKGKFAVIFAIVLNRDHVAGKNFRRIHEIQSSSAFAGRLVAVRVCIQATFDREVPMDTVERAERHWTADEFLAADQHEFGPGWRYELVAGRVVAHAAPSPDHGAIISGLTVALGTRLRGNSLGCRPESGSGAAPARKQRNTARIPDAMIRCRGVPRVVFEVVSPSELKEWRARDTKRRDLQDVEGVAEIVEIYQDDMAVHVYRREADGGWSFEAIGGADGILRLPSVGIEVPLAEIYEFTRSG